MKLFAVTCCEVYELVYKEARKARYHVLDKYLAVRENSKLSVDTPPAAGGD